ncbi:uncharacterized protein LOC123195140 [Mangifera indica]|uniref:uncharacterized protein LOC123195140 n=1 Tax=Mangifera indica TaxID=29780 RepID=UPI001CFB8853|nr:uncharacterized protein LOC123195140 [Mangifera indica]
MNMLESPLEALAFNYVSFGLFTVVNNLWTWIAVITAAVSFWRIKTQVKPAAQPRNDRNISASQAVAEILPDESRSGVEPADSGRASPASPSVCKVKDVEGVTKGKFTLYYYEEENEVESETKGVTVWEDNFNGGEWWERMMRVRRSEMGWYGYQDLTVVNGNVVRIWDECKFSNSRCVVR